MIDDIIVGRIYKSNGNNPYRVDFFAKYGFNPKERLVVVTNISDSSGFPVGEKHVFEEATIRTQFSEYESGEYYEQNLLNDPPCESRLQSCILPLLAK